MMKVKLLRDILVGPSDAMPTPSGTIVDLPEDKAREYIKVGHGAEVKESAERKAEPVRRGRKAK